MACICCAFGKDRNYSSVEMTVNHLYYIVFNAIAIAGVFASNDYLHANLIIITRSKCVLAMGLLKTASHAMNSNLP